MKRCDIIMLCLNIFIFYHTHTHPYPATDTDTYTTTHLPSTPPPPNTHTFIHTHTNKHSHTHPHTDPPLIYTRTHTQRTNASCFVTDRKTVIVTVMLQYDDLHNLQVLKLLFATCKEIFIISFVPHFSFCFSSPKPAD